MTAAFRLIDTGRRPGRENIAFDQAMIDAHQAGDIPDTLRFIEFNPVVLVGRHQAVSQEVHEDFCRKNSIDIGRRITGGGAIYMDEGQLGWALVCNRRSLGEESLTGITEKICTAVAVGLSGLGMDAKFRPRNDIEVNGKKISGTGGFFDSDTLIFQGTILGRVNPAIMFGALNVPHNKVAKRDVGSADLRVTTLEAELGTLPDWCDVKQALANGLAKHLGITLEPGDVTEMETTRTRQIFEEEIGTDEFVYEIDDPARDPEIRKGTSTGKGGIVTANLRVEGPGNDRIREIVLTGDFFATPPRMVYDLESALRGKQLNEVPQTLSECLAVNDGSFLTVTADDIAAAISDAVSGA